MDGPLSALLAGVFAEGEGGGGGGETFDYGLLAPAFDPDTSYKPGSVVLYQDKVWTFTAAHSGMWDPADVEETSLGARILSIADDNDGNITFFLTEG